MQLKFFPVYDAENSTHVFNRSEIQRIFDMFTSWEIKNFDIFGPYEIISFSLLCFYKDGLSQNPYLIYFSNRDFLKLELMLIFLFNDVEISSIIYLTYSVKSSILQRRYYAHGIILY